ncbi:MAG: 2-amino-4-hydroxy-6-hydroxymethyldihydropteridine diphosphokinase [Prevotella sp.]|nr:2-amino-4-hydroxy-6-hydroxymethyldihydropteridine diphosphokinase [Prevotella sp.]
MNSHKVYLGLGSNLGDGRKNLERAIRLIDDRVGPVTRQSSFIETEPWGFESPNKFTNAVILCETTKTPREVLLLTQQIERDMGRRKVNGAGLMVNGQRQYADRIVDIDILLYDDLTIDEPDLKIPHPLMHERDFVMIPLEELKQNKK